MELSDYNGWENKFTWLVHLHLSSEEHLMNEMTSLVTGAPIGYPVGKLVEKWVREALTNWQMNIPDRYRSYDGYLRLLTWDWSVRLWRMPIGIYSSGYCQVKRSRMTTFLPGRSIAAS